MLHNQVDGSPGPVIGYILVQAGINSGIRAGIDSEMISDRLYAMLHEDTGVMGEYEFQMQTRLLQVSKVM